MKVVALLSWFQEKPAWLAATVASCAKFCDHIVAVDGAYLLYPGALKRPYSGTGQAETILNTARGAGIACTIHTPTAAYVGNEVEKRNLLFQLAQPFVTPEQDWLIVMDADMVITKATNVKEKLDRYDPGAADAAEFTTWWCDDMHATQVAQGIVNENDIRPGSCRTRLMFRALHNMRCLYTHWCYAGDRIHEDGEEETIWYWGKPDYEYQCAAVDLTADLEVEHRHAHRSQNRMLESFNYYKRRDEALVEKLPAARGEKVPA